MKKLLLILIPIFLFSCAENKLKNTVWTYVDINELSDTRTILENFVQTTYNKDDVNSALSQFISLRKFDSKLLRDYVATAYKYGSTDSAWMKFPEFHETNVKIEFLTDDKCSIKENINTIFCTYKIENSNLIFYYDMPNGNRIIYDMGTIENDNCIKLRKIADGNCFSKIK